MRIKTILMIVFVGFILSAGLNIYLFYSLDRLQEQFDEQTEIIKKYDDIDRRLNNGDKDILETLEKFLNDQAYVIEGEKASTGDFLMYHNKILDSLDQYKRKYEFASKEYGINLEIVLNADSTVSTLRKVGNSRADSASILYLTFKDRLSIKNGKWITSIPANYKSSYESLLIEFNKIVNQNREAVKQLNELNKKLNKLKTDTIKINNSQ